MNMPSVPSDRAAVVGAVLAVVTMMEVLNRRSRHRRPQGPALRRRAEVALAVSRIPATATCDGVERAMTAPMMLPNGRSAMDFIGDTFGDQADFRTLKIADRGTEPRASPSRPTTRVVRERLSRARSPQGDAPVPEGLPNYHRTAAKLRVNPAPAPANKTFVPGSSRPSFRAWSRAIGMLAAAVFP